MDVHFHLEHNGEWYVFREPWQLRRFLMANSSNEETGLRECNTACTPSTPKLQSGTVLDWRSIRSERNRNIQL